jgi:haloalkane dehalogenase
MSTDHTVEVDGARVYYVDDGAGPTMLLLHGNPTSSFLYRHVIAGLRDRFRCVALDYPGFGRSVAPPGYGFTPREHSRVVERFVDLLGLRDLTLFVQDWGGPIGLGFAGRRPELVRRIVAGNTWAWPVNGDLHFEYFSRLMGGPVGRFFILRYNAFVNLLIPAGVKRKKLSPEVMAAYRAPFPTPDSRWPTAILPREILASRDYLAEVEAGLAALRDRPLLVLWGTKDIAFRARERERLERCFPEHRTVILQGAGHFVQEDAPEEIVAAVGKWAAENGDS